MNTVTVHELRVGHGRRRREARPDRKAVFRRNKASGIAVFGQFGSGNFGNDATLESMLSFLKRTRPDTPVFCICKVPDVVAKSFGIETVPIRRRKGDGVLARILDRLFLKLPGKALDFLQALRHIRRAGVMVVPGTGILGDFSDRPTGMPFDVFKWCLAARLAGTGIAFVSIGAGPIRHGLSRWLMATAARLAVYRSYRDAASMEFMESVGVDTSRDAVYPDLVFKLPVFPSADPDPARPITVGIGVMTYRGFYGFDEGGQSIFEAYAGKMAAFVAHLLDSGYNVRLLTGDDCDAPAVDAILAALGETDPDRLFNESVHSLNDVFRQVAQTDLVVATRFHNVVCALMAGKPVISLGYTGKNDQLLEQVGLGEYCQHVESFDVGLLVKQFSRLTEHREQLARTIRAQVLEFKESLELQELLLSAIL